MLKAILAAASNTDPLQQKRIKAKASAVLAHKNNPKPKLPRVIKGNKPVRQRPK